LRGSDGLGIGMSLGDSIRVDPLEKLMDEGVVRVIEGFMQEVGILGRLVFRLERPLRRRSVFEHRVHLGKRRGQPALESGEALSVNFYLRTFVDPVDETALNLEAARGISDKQRLLNLRQHPLALRHRLLFAGLQLGDGTAVFGGQAFPFAGMLLDQRGQTMLFGDRVR